MKMINRDIRNVLFYGITFTVFMSVVCLFIEPVCAIICLISGILITAVFVRYTKSRYKELEELNNYLSLVCSGNFDLDISDNTEGELSILKNNLFKIITLLKTQNEELEKDKVYLVDLLADISHQLKTPLTSMMVMTDLLKDEEKNQRQSEFIDIIESQLDKMKWLITNLLKLSKLDAGTSDFKNEKFASKDLLQKSIKPFLISLDLKGITLKNTAKDFTINGDINWTIEGFENIIKNCIEHTDKNGILSIKSKHTSIYNAIIISDNGCGIAKEDLPHIFERFYHGKNSSSDSVGIGLALAKTVLEKEHGTIDVQSEEGKGTEFEIRFYKAIV